LRAYRQQARQRWKASPAGEAWKRAYDARRRARVEHLDADRITIRALAERDGWTCHLCGETVPDVRHRKGKPKMDGPTIDHRLPLALGGQHTWDNVALAHFICNSRRGAMPLEVSA
jgi:5-methylcytosine-specific restriction endonuclease McrA